MKFTMLEVERDGTSQLVIVDAPDAEKFNYSPLDVVSQIQKYEGKKPDKVVIYRDEPEE